MHTPSEPRPTLAELAAQVAETTAAIAAEPIFPDPAADIRSGLLAGIDAAVAETDTAAPCRTE